MKKITEQDKLAYQTRIEEIAILDARQTVFDSLASIMEQLDCSFEESLRVLKLRKESMLYEKELCLRNLKNSKPYNY
jgi:hypothetical protein